MGLIWFILGCLLVLAGVAFGAYSRRVRRQVRAERLRDETWGRPRVGVVATPSTASGAAGLAILLAALGSFTIFMDSYTVVGAREVAVQTMFGKVQGNPLGAGWHWVAPWNNIEKFDASVQTLKFYKDEKDDDGSCVTVRLANSTNACVDVTAQWNINYRGDVNALYLSYKTFENVHDNLVKRQLQSALNEVFGSYNPLAAIGTADDKPQTNTKQLQDQVRIALQRDLGTAIEIPSVTIPLIHFDGDTETRLKNFQAEKADTRIAEQRKLTAIEQAAANKILAQDPSVKDPGVQYQNCLNTTRELAKADQLKNLPPTWNCNTAGDATGVIVQAK